MRPKVLKKKSLIMTKRSLKDKQQPNKKKRNLTMMKKSLKVKINPKFLEFQRKLTEPDQKKELRAKINQNLIIAQYL